MTPFPPPSRDEWLQRAHKAARGAPFNADEVLFQRREGPRAERPVQAPWAVFARVDHPDVMKARLQAEEDLANGVSGLTVTSAGAVTALGALPLHQVALRNEGGDEGAAALAKLVKGMPLDPARLAVDFGVEDAGLARLLHAQGFVGPLMRGDGRSFHEKGVSDGGTLGAALATAVAALRKLDFLEGEGLARSVSLTLPASQDMFGTLAGFRAARILWRDILQASGLPESPLSLHGETSRLMMAGVDAHMNILRGVAATFGAGLGGADSICVLPFSVAQGLPNGFSRRISRNLQNLLIHEANLWRVSDPAAGAGALETRTEQLCDEAWSVLQACEKGQWPTGDVAKARARPVIGVSVFQPAAEMAAEVETP